MPPAVVVTDLRHDFELDEERSVPALRLPALTVAAGERVALRGANGSGKTTLLNIVAGLLRPTAGRVEIEGVDLYSLGAGRRDRLRARRIGYLFQAFHLLDTLTALENVLCAAGFAGVHPRGERGRRARELLERFGLEDRLDHRPTQLSMGEQQRVAAVRALINDPGIVLCDEPTASLDQATAGLLLADLERVCDERGTTLIVASHDPLVLGRFPVHDLTPAADA